MSYLDFQFEILRGQIEELQGRLEEMLALRRGRGGMFGSLRGRSRRMRGRARQTYARARYGVLGFKSQVKAPSMPSISMPSVKMPTMPKMPGVPTAPRPRSSPSTKYVLVAVGIMLALTAALWPGLLTALWKQASSMMSSSTSQNDPLTSSEL